MVIKAPNTTETLKKEIEILINEGDVKIARLKKNLHTKESNDRDLIQKANQVQREAQKHLEKSSQIQQAYRQIVDNIQNMQKETNKTIHLIDKETSSKGVFVAIFDSFKNMMDVLNKALLLLGFICLLAVVKVIFLG